MNTSENIYYLKGDSLFKVENGGKNSVSLEDILVSKEKYSLLIDDGYFFHIGIENVSVTGSKLRDIAANYLNIMFPDDMVKSFGMYQTKGVTIIFVISASLIELIKDNKELFSSAKKISTPFFELVSRYEDFIFSDGERFYKKSGSGLFPASQDSGDFITAADLFEEITEVKNYIKLSGVNSSGFSKAPLLIPIATLVACYIMFVAGSVLSASSTKNLEVYYDEAINKIYKTLGVNKAGDPYGVLLSRSKALTNDAGGKRVLDILSEVSSVDKAGASFNTLSIRDKTVRIDGTASDFTQVDNLKKIMEEKLKINVSMDDTKKTEKGISFVMKYEQ